MAVEPKPAGSPMASRLAIELQPLPAWARAGWAVAAFVRRVTGIESLTQTRAYRTLAVAAGRCLDAIPGARRWATSIWLSTGPLTAMLICHFDNLQTAQCYLDAQPARRLLDPWDLFRSINESGRQAIAPTILPGKRNIAVCLPGQAYEQAVAGIIDGLKQRGLNVIKLVGSRSGASASARPGNGIFYVAGNMWKDITRELPIDLFILVSHEVDLPPEARVVWFSHDIHDSPAWGMRRAYRSISLIDYFFIPSTALLERTRLQVQEARRFIAGRRPKHACLIPGGYPRLDQNLHRFASEGLPEATTIVFAPTKIQNEVPGSVLRRHGEAVVDAILTRFPECRLIFRPHPYDQDSAAVSRIRRKYRDNPRLQLDRDRGSYISSYTRASLMITDMSGTAYTYAFTTLRPVVFFSPDEARVTSRLGNLRYFQDRQRVGKVARNTKELTSAVKELLENNHGYSEAVRRYRDSFVYNLGHSEEYFLNNIDCVFGERRHPDWEYID